MAKKVRVCVLFSIAMALSAGTAKGVEQTPASTPSSATSPKPQRADIKNGDKKTAAKKSDGTSKGTQAAAPKSSRPQVFATTTPSYDEWHGFWPPGLPPGWFEPLVFSATMPRDPAAFKRFDRLVEPGLNTIYPPQIDTILGDVGGWRSALADQDIGIQLRMVTAIVDNPLATGQPNYPTRYNGQNFTLQNEGVVFNATAALDKYGLTNAKFVFGVNQYSSNVDLNGPDGVNIRGLYYYQDFFEKALAIKIGYISNMYEYAGLFVGGSPVFSNGLSGVIPLQVGLSGDPIAKPAVNVTLNGKDGLYIKGGVQVSVSPEGRNYELLNNKGGGLDWALPGAGPLYLGEVGINRTASPTEHRLWLRAGGMYNTSEYDQFLGKGTASNGTAYVAGDYQFWQLDKMLPFRGLYAGSSYFWAPEDVNVIAQSWEGRIYGVGLFDSRPLDTMTFRLNWNKFSADAQELYSSFGAKTHADQINLSASYSYHMGAGIYLIPALAWIKNPSFVGNFKDALSMQGTVYFFF